MTQEEKQLLLQDLCERLPYRVKVLDNSHKDYGVSNLINIGLDGSILINNEINDIQYYPIIDEVKPYLRPMSSMTKEETKELFKEIGFEFTCNTCGIPAHYNYEFAKQIKGIPTITNVEFIKVIDWLNKKMFDYRGLIEKGLALEVPEGMYN